MNVMRLEVLRARSLRLVLAVVVFMLLGSAVASAAVIIGTQQGDELPGTNEADLIIGKSGGDEIDGKAGKDVLLGGRGNDVVEGGADRDLIRGGRGADQAAGGPGSDRVLLGRGTDKGIYRLPENLSDRDVYDGNRGYDTLVIETDQATLDALGITTADIEDHFNARAPRTVWFKPLGFKLVAKRFQAIQVRVPTLAPTIGSFSPLSAAPGTQITIQGLNLVNTSLVSFNGVSAAIQFIDPGGAYVNALVPALATTGPIQVTTPGGTATSATNFVVVVA